VRKCQEAKKAKKLQPEAAEKQKQQQVAEVKYKNYFAPHTTKKNATDKQPDNNPCDSGIDMNSSLGGGDYALEEDGDDVVIADNP
jgi:hypothetical protein